MPSLNGKTALVTGASRGMGRASATRARCPPAPGSRALRPRRERSRRCCRKRYARAVAEADAIAMDLAAADGAGKLATQARSIIGGSPGHPCRQCRGLESCVHRGNHGSRISISSSRSMSARRISWCSSCFPVWARGSSVILVSSSGRTPPSAPVGLRGHEGRDPTHW